MGAIAKGIAHPEGENPVRLGKGENKRPRAVVSRENGEPYITLFGYNGQVERILEGNIPVTGIKMAS